MLNILYTVFIFPIELLIELFYVFVFRIFNNPALSILGVSFAVSILTLPLYFIAEKYQRSERDMQNRLNPEVTNIKTVFFGDERFMRLAAYYRQNGYHPLYSLRSSISLIIQIPFFIAAYHFLLNLGMIKGISFGPITDLSKPDSFLQINGFSINLLPIIMTIINCASAAIYTKGFTKNEKIQLFGMAGIFLAMLYNSPSGMVLYWTSNNLFSLIKNIIQKTKNPKFVTFLLSSIFCFLLITFVLFIHDGRIVKRIGLSVPIALIPLLQYFFLKKQKKSISIIKKENLKPNRHIFILSLAVLFLLAGFIIPSSLISSSVQEFSLLESLKHPFSFLSTTLLQSFGIFIVWPLIIYLIFSQSSKMAKSAVILAGFALVNTFLFPGKYGFLTLFFTLSESISSGRLAIFLNFIVMTFIAILILFLIRYYKKIMVSILTISFCACLVLGINNSIKIHREFRSFQLQLARNEDRVRDINEPVYQFSKTGKNVLVIMLDMAISGYIPYIFNEKPDLHKSFDGFTWYRNTISFGGHTNFATSGLFGGYEYTPLEIQARTDTPLVEKHNEALLLLPRIFLDNGFKVTVTEPTYANYKWVPDLCIFDEYPQINAENIIGKFNKKWLSEKKNQTELNLSKVIEIYLIRFSLFKFVPLVFRNFFYDNGNWLTTFEGNRGWGIDFYIALDILPDITGINEDIFNSYNVLTNDLPHRSHFLQAPYYIPSNNITNKGDGPFANNEHYHVNIASFLLLGKYFEFLKLNDVYNNSRIIIVSDHGNGQSNLPEPDNFILPNGEQLQRYASLLMVKDFDSHGDLSINNEFMTNADVPFIALNDIIENLVNPWTGKPIKKDKENGVTLTTSSLWDVNQHSKYHIKIKEHEWLHVRNYIFDINNWNLVNN